MNSEGYMHRKETIVAFFVGLIVGIGATWLWFDVADRTKEQLAAINGSNQESEEDPGEDVGGTLGMNFPVTPPQNAFTYQGSEVRVNDQPAGDEVIVERVRLEEPMWVAVHEILPDGSLGNALGAGLFSAEEQSGIVKLLRETAPGTDYYAVLYSSNGNQLFEFRGADAPITDEEGTIVKAVFSTD